MRNVSVNVVAGVWLFKETRQVGAKGRSGMGGTQTVKGAGGEKATYTINSGHLDRDSQ